MKVVINYGHGPKDVGYDPGAIGPTGYQEASQNKEVGELVVTKLKKNGWQILAIQDGDLWDVTNRANDYNPHYFLSIHANSFADYHAHGIETIALGAGGMGEKMAKEIQKELVTATSLTDRGVKFNNLHVLRETDCPAALVEIGFISNPAEEALMKQDSFDETVASAICRGVSRAVGVPYTEVVKPVSPQLEPIVVMYRVILDGKQVMALSYQDAAIAEVKKAVDTGQAQKGSVQRNTDDVNVFEYVKKG
ncbi:N-acetylmuramoyl-L-alanine amidase family protein [Desulfosporosinus fructosivorans]